MTDGRAVVVGGVGGDGRLSFDLNAAVPAEWRIEASDLARLRTVTSDLGEVALSNLYAAREDAAWHELASSTCIDAADVTDCVGEKRYIERFGAGEHAAEARSRVDTATAKQEAAEEQAAWSALDVDACAKPTAKDSGAVLAGCRPLERFAARYPASSHAAVLTEALGRGNGVRERLARAEAQRAQHAERAAYTVPSSGFIPYEGNGGGPTQCADGSWSHSSGRGTCSHHGGIGGGGSRSSAPRSRRH